MDPRFFLFWCLCSIAVALLWSLGGSVHKIDAVRCTIARVDSNEFLSVAQSVFKACNGIPMIRHVRITSLPNRVVLDARISILALLAFGKLHRHVGNLLGEALRSFSPDDVRLEVNVTTMPLSIFDDVRERLASEREGGSSNGDQDRDRLR